jgi:hypothetical protein
MLETLRMMLPRERIQSALAYLGIGGISWRRLLSLCSDVRQVAILKHLHCEDDNLHRHRAVNCRASMEANFRFDHINYSLKKSYGLPAG